jgi:hypothetical protein
MAAVPSVYEEGIRIGFTDPSGNKVTPIVSTGVTTTARKIAAGLGPLARMLQFEGGRKR